MSTKGKRPCKCAGLESSGVKWRMVLKENQDPYECKVLQRRREVVLQDFFFFYFSRAFFPFLPAAERYFIFDS
jgi:hypothetical protein